MLNIPNILTLVRILVIPFFVLAFYLPTAWGGHLIAAVIFALACLTDWLDGYLARSLKLATRFGAFLDPVADKMMVCIALVMIVAEPQFQALSLHTSYFQIPSYLVTIPSAIIVSREIVVSSLREWMAEIGKTKSVAVSNLGKIKTTVQMIALVVLIYCRPDTQAWLTIVGMILLYVAAILTVWSMMLYLRAAWPEFSTQ